MVPRVHVKFRGASESVLLEVREHGDTVRGVGGGVDAGDAPGRAEGSRYSKHCTRRARPRPDLFPGLQVSPGTAQHQQASSTSATPPLGIVASLTGPAFGPPHAPFTAGLLRTTTRSPVVFT